jgi:hypothetical protein
LKPTFLTMQGIFDLADKVSTDVVSYEVRAEMLHEIGNVLRKMSENEMAIEALKLADYTLTKHQAEDGSSGKRHMYALLLIPDIIMTDAHYNCQDPNRKKERIDEAIEEAREVLKIATETNDSLAYRAKVILANLINNTFHLGLAEPTQESVSECILLAKEAREVALTRDDQNTIRRADAVLRSSN